MTLTLNTRQQAARDWFEALRTRICEAFETIEREAGSDARFEYLPWDRTDHDGSPGGGGVRGVMKGKVFEKVGVNVSTVGGSFNPDFAQNIHGAAEDPSFFATGVSLVAHMANPHVPAVHMNTRYLVTTKDWFGGGADLNPPMPYDEDTADFHARLRAACAPYGPDVYERYKAWADEYFWIPHRNVHRGVGGIFYDHLENSSDVLFEQNFALTRDVGEAFLDIFPKLVRRRMDQPFTPEEKYAQRVWRGRYAEFNLVYDRGTTFGLKTGGNVDAILMSLPPTWFGNDVPFTPVANGEIGAIVTSLEMTERPALDAIPVSELRLERWVNPTPDQYRALYRRVGEPWLWFSRLELDDDALNTVTHDPKICIWAVMDQNDAEVGILELDFREGSQCEIAFFGLVPELSGKGHGKWLMRHALNAGWGEPGVKRMWVHTCTLDGPGALAFYIKSGFTPFQRQVETFKDPRLSGLIPIDAAPQIPLIR